jgi:23S rRNA pseudouridine1911/1915/1917 synthase
MFHNLITGLGRQALHAKTLGFEHPKTGEVVRFDSELPDDFQHVLTMLRENCKDEY